MRNYLLINKENKKIFSTDLWIDRFIHFDIIQRKLNEKSYNNFTQVSFQGIVIKTFYLKLNKIIID
jgi:hypothetical protein